MGIVDAGKFNKGDGTLNLELFRSGLSRGQNGDKSSTKHGGLIATTSMHEHARRRLEWGALEVRRVAPASASRGDLNRVIRMMLSELAVGHSFPSEEIASMNRSRSRSACSAPTMRRPMAATGFKTIYGGAFWDPSLRSPLIAPGMDVKPGEFLLAVDGKEITTDSEVYRHFEGTAGKRVELKVGLKADGTGRAQPDR